MLNWEPLLNESRSDAFNGKVAVGCGTVVDCASFCVGHGQGRLGKKLGYGERFDRLSCLLQDHVFLCGGVCHSMHDRFTAGVPCARF